MSLNTLSPAETSIAKIASCVRQLVQYIQQAGFGTGSVTSIATAGLASGGPITTAGTVTVAITTATNSLGADVALNNIANYFDGPSVAQGTSGTWFASGTVTVLVPSAPVNIRAKLWDGTTVIASASSLIGGGSNFVSIALSGYLANPAANIRISVRDDTNTNSKITFNWTGTSKDSTLSVLRIA